LPIASGGCNYRSAQNCCASGEHSATVAGRANETLREATKRSDALARREA